MYGTPLDDLDLIGHWSSGSDVKVQHYAQLPSRDSVANLAGCPSANNYWIPRADLDPSAMPEFVSMVNSVIPGLGRKVAAVMQVIQEHCNTTCVH